MANNQLGVHDDKGTILATIVPYRTSMLTMEDPTVDATLDSYHLGPHQDTYNSVSFYMTLATDSQYPYVGKSDAPRAPGAGVPGPTGVYDLQLFPSSDQLIVAAFVVPFTGVYTVSDLAARRVSSMGDHAFLKVFVDNEEQASLPEAPKDGKWVTMTNPVQLGMRSMGQQIRFAVHPGNDGNATNDAVQIAWTITAE